MISDETKRKLIDILVPQYNWTEFEDEELEYLRNMVLADYWDKEYQGSIYQATEERQERSEEWKKQVKKLLVEDLDVLRTFKNM